jgi:ketosteroid isomerase-like protein
MSEKNIQTIKDIYAAFGRGDVPGILAHISDDIRHFGVVSDSPVTHDIPWHLQIKKKADVPRFFQALAENTDFTRFEPSDFAAAGNVVYASIVWDATVKKNGKKLQNVFVLHRFTFDAGGKVVEWRGSEDTARTVEALR